jgi:hypothetical protein
MVESILNVQYRRKDHQNRNKEILEMRPSIVAHYYGNFVRCLELLNKPHTNTRFSEQKPPNNKFIVLVVMMVAVLKHCFFCDGRF